MLSVNGDAVAAQTFCIRLGRTFLPTQPSLPKEIGSGETHHAVPPTARETSRWPVTAGTMEQLGANLSQYPATAASA